MAVDTAVRQQLPVVLATSPGLRKLGELLWLRHWYIRDGVTDALINLDASSYLLR